MNIETAYKILGIEEYDSWEIIKKKYKKQIILHHPDANIEEAKIRNEKSQKIIEAFSLIKNNYKKKEKIISCSYNAIINSEVFCPRYVYQYYSMKEEKYYYRAYYGKYMWNPEEEEFQLFIKSIHEIIKDKLDEIEESIQIIDRMQLVKKREEYEKILFNNLLFQFSDPYELLNLLKLETKEEETGREIYYTDAYIFSKGEKHIIEKLKENELLYPWGFDGNKIGVSNLKGERLGFLYVKEDKLYLAIIPILKYHYGKIKIKIDTVQKFRNSQYEIKVGVWILIENKEYATDYEMCNIEIENLLIKYKKELKNYK